MKVPPHQISLQARQAFEADPSAKFILLRLPPDAFSGSAVDVNAASWPVETCGSPLAVRDAMRRQRTSSTPVVLIYAGAENDLGTDVLARCAKRRAISHDIWQTALGLFRAAHVDPRLARHRWLAELLVRFMPAEGYVPVRSLVLDQDRAWQEFLRTVLKFGAAPPSAPDLIGWASDAQRRAQFDLLDESAKDATMQYLREWLGELVPLVFAAIDAGTADQLTAIALLCEPLRETGAGQAVVRATVLARIEGLFGGRTLDSSAVHQLAATAELWFERTSEQERELHIGHYERLVVQMKAEALAPDSRYGSLALREKIKAFAAALSERDVDEAMRRLESLASHRGPIFGGPKLLRCRMAVRVVRWLCRPAYALPQGLNALVESYRNEIAWLDWALTVLLEGDDSAELAIAYAQLRERARNSRDAFDRRFAEALVSDPLNGESYLPIEHTLDRCIATLAEASRILLIVMDGMSIPVFLELHHSLKDHGWIQGELPPNACPTLLSMLPSTTEASRTTLFCGTPCTGSAASERSGFAARPSLVARSVASKPPVVFHKRDLIDLSGVTLADNLRHSIGDTRQRIVAAVINAVDDHLMKSDQLRLRWTVAQFRGLDALLAEARSSGRIVIFTSDHGHILEQDSECVGTSANARWREPNLESFEGEVRLRSQRVKAASGLDEVVLAWNSRIRYAGKRNGYHGGCSPAEALVPLACYQFGVLDGNSWKPREEVPPAWW